MSLKEGEGRGLVMMLAACTKEETGSNLRRPFFELFLNNMVGNLYVFHPFMKNLI